MAQIQLSIYDIYCESRANEMLSKLKENQEYEFSIRMPDHMPLLIGRLSKSGNIICPVSDELKEWIESFYAKSLRDNTIDQAQLLYRAVIEC